MKDDDKMTEKVANEKTIMLFVGCFAFLAIGDSYYTVDGIEYEYGYSEDRANAIAFDNPNTVVPASVSLPIYDWKGNIEGWMTYRVVSTRECICPPEDLLLKSLVFDGDIEVIGDFSFAESANLKSVSMKNVELISWAAFCDCSNLSTVEWGDVKTIGGYAFSGCSKLKTWSWPSQCHVLDAAFSGTGIEQVRIPADVEFGTHVLDNCKSLTSAVFETGVTVVPDGIFAGCSQLVDIELPNGISRIGYQAFQQCECLKEIQLPETIQEIGDDAFHSDKALVNINIPNSLSKIGAGAFALTALTNVDLSHLSIDRIADETFLLCSDLKSIKLPPSVKEIGDEAFSHSAITNGDFSGLQITNIGESAFAFCDNLANLVLPETLQSLGYRAIYEAGGNCNPLRAMLAECGTYQEMQKVIESQEYKDALKAELANPTVGTVEFRGPPPQMEDSVFCFEDKCISANFYVRGKYSPKYAVLWRAAIAEWDATHGTTNEWHGLQFKADIVVEPTDWKLEVDGKQTLTISWHFPTNETYTIDKATADLKAQGKKYKIYRGKDDEKFWDDFSKKECIVESTSDLSYPDEAFGDIKGTHPVRYWVEVIGEDAMNTPEPVHCDTRRRFGLAVGVSEFGQEWNGVARPPHGIKQIRTSTERFAKILRDGGGVVGFDDLTVLLDEDATLDRVSREIARLPYDADGVKRLVPGDEVYLWMFSHGIYANGGTPETLCGGIDLYDGYYFSGMAGVLPLKPEDPPARSTFNADLSWVDEYPGVRIVGILPFCHAKLMCRDFMDRENVAWITAAEERESAASSNMENCDYTQFCEYFLNSGIKKGLANLSGVIGRPYQDVKSISVGAISRDPMGHTPILLADLTRYAKNLSFGFGSECPAHVDMSGAVNILEDLQVADVAVKPGSAPRALSFGVRTDDKGLIALDVEIKDCTDVLVWFRRVGAANWRWVSVHAKVSELGFGQLSSGTRTTMIFGLNTDDDVFRMGRFYPNETYQFAVQGVNHYGYGPVSGPTLATTGDIPVDAATAKRLLREKMEYLMGGVCFAMAGEGDTTARVSASRSDAGYHVSAAVTVVGESATYGADATADDIGEDGTLHLICRREDGDHTLSDSLEVVLSVDGAVCMVDEKLLFCLRESNESYRITSRLNPGEVLSIQTPEVGMEGTLTYAAQGLPKGLSINVSTGEIAGKVFEPGSYVVLVTVKSKTDPTQTETIEVPIVIGNYVDETIGVDDEYGPYVPGEKVELKFPEGAAWKVTGLPTGLKWDAKLPGVTGVPTKPGSNTVYFTWTDKTVTPNVTHKASSTFIVGPLPKASVQIEGKGKVTGAGAYLANKKVTLKATASKGYVFTGWYLGEKLVSRSASFSFKLKGGNVNYNARFVTVAEDKASVVAAVKGLAFAAGGANKVTSLATNVMCGVALSWPLSHRALSATSVKVTGLPKGLKYDTKKKAITGVPTAPGKTSSVKIAVTTAGKQKVTFTLKVKVVALPEWAKGQFTGTVWPVAEGRDSTEGTVLTMSVGSTGKISGKFKSGITNWTFSASSYAKDSVTVGDTNLVCSATAKGTYTVGSGKSKKTKSVTAPISVTLVAAPDVSPIASSGTGDFADGTDNVEIRRIAATKLSVNDAKGGTVKTDKSYGQAAAGTKVKLTATLKKGYALLGCYDKVTGELLSQKTSFSLVSDGVTDRFVEARFAKESDLSAADFALDWNAPTNLTVGVSYSASPKVSGSAAVKIASVSGLPAGLSYKSGKVTGVATTAKTNTVSVTVALATNTKKTWTLKQRLIVETLPDWAKGTYVGGFAEGTVTNQVTLTVGSTGKVSGKLNFENASWTLSGTKYTKLDQEAKTAALSLTAKKGSTKKTLTVTVSADELGGWAASETSGFAFEARQNLWKKDDAWAACAAELVGVEYADPAGDLTVTFGANGTATAKLKVGKNTFPCSSVLCPTAIGEDLLTGRLYLYFAPNTKKNFKGAVRIVGFQSW